MADGGRGPEAGPPLVIVRGMDKKCLLAVVAGLALVVFAASARARSASALFNGPQNMDAGLQNGLNNITCYVAFLSPGAKMLETKGFRLSGGDQNRR